MQQNGCVGDHPLPAADPAPVVKGHVGSEAAGLYRNNVGDRAGSDVVASASSSVSQAPGASRPAAVVAAGAISLVAAGRAAAAIAAGDAISFVVGVPRVVVGFVFDAGPAERAVASAVGRRRSSAAATVAAAVAVVAAGVFAMASSLGCVVAVHTAGLAFLAAFGREAVAAAHAAELCAPNGGVCGPSDRDPVGWGVVVDREDAYTLVR
ncbi:hypothetical protein CBR_g31662 [Chara braunii]|uniref:Uncharacterized protein n=1 Tax=Chara braunii TaxID=69332 RepID=A0A388JY59_CHABU|nr:hypothetical protein CBR_g31662 [Chara braunii]|eukprot:GBG62643.1 hypothetical protein CBR_g31662 [Chara braunii]